MLKLYILRHAKTAWAAPGQNDSDRLLTERGKADLENIRLTIAKGSYFPSHIYCSPSVRTRATLDGIKSEFPGSPKIEYPDRLYSGSTSDYFNTIQAHTSQEPLMFIGHNPMCASLTMQLCGKGEASALANVAMKFPAGTLVVIEFEFESWPEISGQSGYLKAFHQPQK